MFGRLICLGLSNAVTVAIANSGGDGCVLAKLALFSGFRSAAEDLAGGDIQFATGLCMTSSWLGSALGFG